MNTTDITTLVATRKRNAWTGSAAAAACELTDAALEDLLTQQPSDSLMGGYRTYTRTELQRAATLELAWRRENGVQFGWTRR